MQKLLFVLLGGALGTGMRYGVAAFVNSLLPPTSTAPFPWATWAINVTGSLAIGFIAALADERGLMESMTRLALVTGVLGGYTTFSTFSLETYNLLRLGRFDLALLNVAGSVLVGLAAVWLGVRLAALFS